MGRPRRLPVLAATALTLTCAAALACGGSEGGSATPASTGTLTPPAAGTVETRTALASSPATSAPSTGTATPTPAPAGSPGSASPGTSTGTAAPAAATPGVTVTPTAGTGIPPITAARLTFRNMSTFIDAFDESFVIVGEVVNNGTEHLHYLELKVRLLDAAGAVIREDFGVSMFEIVPADGGIAPFVAVVVDPPPGIARFDIAFFASEPVARTGVRPPVGLDLTVTRVDVDPEDDLLILTGTVRNTSPHAYFGVRPVFAFYDAAGAVVRVAATFVDVETLAPGATALFEATVFDASTWSYVRYQGWADAVIEP